MSDSPRTPKQWQLMKKETITSCGSWRQNFMYILLLGNNFLPYLEATWQKQTATNPLLFKRINAHLDLPLGQIANFYPAI